MANLVNAFAEQHLKLMVLLKGVKDVGHLTVASNPRQQTHLKYAKSDHKDVGHLTVMSNPHQQTHLKYATFRS